MTSPSDLATAPETSVIPPPTAAAHRSRLRGVHWASTSALGSAGFMIPWKLATRHGEAKDLVAFDAGDFARELLEG